MLKFEIMYIIPEIYEKINPFISTHPLAVSELLSKKTSVARDGYDDDTTQLSEIVDDCPISAARAAYNEIEQYYADQKQNE